MRITGQTVKRTVSDEEVATFVPFPLPPRKSVLNVDGDLELQPARTHDRSYLDSHAALCSRPRRSVGSYAECDQESSRPFTPLYA